MVPCCQFFFCSSHHSHIYSTKWYIVLYFYYVCCICFCCDKSWIRFAWYIKHLHIIIVERIEVMLFVKNIYPFYWLLTTYLPLASSNILQLLQTHQWFFWVGRGKIYSTLSLGFQGDEFVYVELLCDLETLDVVNSLAVICKKINLSLVGMHFKAFMTIGVIEEMTLTFENANDTDFWKRKPCLLFFMFEVTLKFSLRWKW